MLRAKIFYVLILIIVPISVFAQDMINNLEKILLRNVTVIDQSGKTDDLVVSILIEQQELHG